MFFSKMLCLYGWFLKWWYPQNTPKWLFVVGKTHGCWVPAFSETSIWYFKGTSDSQKWIGFRWMIQTHPDVSWKSDVIQPLLGCSCFLGCSWNLRFVPLKPGDGKQIYSKYHALENVWNTRYIILSMGLRTHRYSNWLFPRWFGIFAYRIYGSGIFTCNDPIEMK